MKFYNYVVIMLGIMIIFNAAGYQPPVGGTVKTLIIGNDTDCESPPCTKMESVEGSSLYVKILAALSLAAAVGVVAGFYFNLPSVSYLIAGVLSTFLGLFLIDMIWLYKKMIEHGDTWMIFLITAIFAPLLIGFIISSLEWWQGND